MSYVRGAFRLATQPDFRESRIRAAAAHQITGSGRFNCLSGTAAVIVNVLGRLFSEGIQHLLRNRNIGVVLDLTH